MSGRTSELGDACAFCVDCGYGRRYQGGDSSGIPDVCPDCDGTVVRSCPDCGSTIRSLMALTCPCGHVYREDIFFGRPIRRKAERHDLRAPECAGEVASALDITAASL
jgi:hypothetical protein